jgi:hypothetical protein
MASKYDKLQQFLAASAEDVRRYTLTLDQIGLLVGGLPPIAKERPQWWENEESSPTRHVQGKAWMGAGWRTTNVNLKRGVVSFVRSS